MCPTIVKQHNGSRVGLGASGGRRIMPAVLQLISFMVDFSMDSETAIHQPGIDVNGSKEVLFDTRLTSKVAEELSRNLDNLTPKTHGVFPSLFSCPGIVQHHLQSGGCTGASFPHSPLAAAVAEIPID